jgi:hypothetical protein
MLIGDADASGNPVERDRFPQGASGEKAFGCGRRSRMAVKAQTTGTRFGGLSGLHDPVKRDRHVHRARGAAWRRVWQHPDREHGCEAASPMGSARLHLLCNKIYKKLLAALHKKPGPEATIPEANSYRRYAHRLQ